MAKRVFARAARRPVATPPELADRIEALLARRCCDLLGLARRAGSAVAGFDRVGEALRRHEAALLLFALDGAEGGQRRLGGIGREAALATALYGGELGAVFGRDRVVHAMVRPGRLSDRLRGDLRRLAGFRPAATVEWRQDGGIGTND